MKNATLKKYLGVLIGGLAMMTVVIVAEGKVLGYEGMILRLLCDGLFVGGALLLVIAGFAMVASSGGFRYLGYMGKRIFKKAGKTPDDLTSYSDYVQSCKEGKKLNLTPVLVVGGVFVVISIILAFLL